MICKFWLQSCAYIGCVLGPKLICETGLVKFVTAVARLVFLDADLLGKCLSHFANINFGRFSRYFHP